MPIFVAVWRPFPENKQSIQLSTSTYDDSRSNQQELSTVCSCSKQLFSILWLFSRIGYHTSNILYLRLEDRDWEYETDVWLQSSIGIDPWVFFPYLCWFYYCTSQSWIFPGRSVEVGGSSWLGLDRWVSTGKPNPPSSNRLYMMDR